MDQTWWSAEVLFASPPNTVTKIPAAGSNDQWCHETVDHQHKTDVPPINTVVLLEVRLYAWTPTALHLSQMYALMRHKFREDDAMDMDFVVDFNRRKAEAERLRNIQCKHVPSLKPISTTEMGKHPLLDYDPAQEECLDY